MDVDVFLDFSDFRVFPLYGRREGNQASPGVPGCVGVFSTIGWAILRTFENPLFWSFVEELVVSLGVGCEPRRWVFA